MTGFHGPLPPAQFNMAQYVLSHANDLGEKTALEIHSSLDGDTPETWTYDAFSSSVLDVAARIRATLADKPSGQFIAITLGNSSLFPICYLGVIAAGHIAVPLSDQLTSGELHHVFSDTEPALILCDTPNDEVDLKQLTPPEFSSIPLESRLRTFADTAADDPAFLIYTSGTTAKPKGVLHAQRSIWGRRPMYDGWYGITQHDRLMHAGAFNWTYTLGTGLMDVWSNGATSVIYTGEKRPEYWPRLIQDHNTTIFAAVPGVYRQILKYGDAPLLRDSSLRHGLCAGERLPGPVRNEWLEATGTPLYEAFGMSEISTYISSSPIVPSRWPAIGKAQAGRHVEILPDDNVSTAPLARGETGVLAVHRSDPGMMLGYWKRPDEEAVTRRGAWFIGGDLASMDDDGYITHEGRTDDLMNAQGYRVSPQDIEAVLSTHPAIEEVAVGTVEARQDVSIICAFVVERSGKSITLDDLRSFASNKLANYKMPREVVCVDELPRTRSGKLMRKDFASLFATHHQSASD